jgi:hypothetical protein
MGQLAEEPPCRLCFIDRTIAGKELDWIAETLSDL